MEIIAEIANSHQGSKKILFSLLDELSNLSVKTIKFQIYFAEELLSKKHTRFEHFKNQSFSNVEWKKIIDYSKKKKFKIYADIFGLKAFKLAEKLNVDGYKIHSSDLINFKLLNQVKKTKKKIFLSVGGCNGFEISYALSFFKKKVTLMHGYQDYPTNINKINLFRIKWLLKNFGTKCDIGYQDHTDGAKINDSVVLCTSAIAKGATCIEKHVTLNRKLRIDRSSSLSPNNFLKFKKKILKFTPIFGENKISFSKEEINYRNQVKKVLVAKKNIKKNTIIDNQHLEFKRVNKIDFYSSYFEDFFHKKTKKNLDKDCPMRLSDVENKINAFIIVRLKSKRLKKKSLLKINGQTLLEHLIKRVKKINKLNKIILCTSLNKQDKILANIAKKNNIEVFRGDENDVLKRMFDCSKKFKSDHYLRITGDDILIDPMYAEKTIATHLDSNADYTDCKDIPSGTEVEIFSRKTIMNLYNQLKDRSGTEYLTNYIIDNREFFNISSCKIIQEHKSNLRLTIDTLNDFKTVKSMLEDFKIQKILNSYNLSDIIKYFKKNKSKIFNKKVFQMKIPIKFKTDISWV